MKERKSFPEIVIQVRKILIKEKELSIKQIADRTKSQWRTIRKALDLLKELDFVKERSNDKVERFERLFSLK